MLRNTYYERDEMRLQITRVSLKEYYEVEYWSKRFGVSPEILRAAVKESGSELPGVVEQYISNKYLLR